MRRTRPSRDDALRAALTLASAVLAFCATYAVCLRAGSGAQPAILAAILSLGLSRRTRSAHDVPLLVLPLVLAGVALAASGVGWLFVHLPVAGAAVFVAGLFLSIWLRNFGANARRAGALLALPLVAMLIVPPPDLSAPGGAATALALTILAGIIAPLSAAIVRRLGAFVGLHPAAEAATAPNEARSATAGLTVPTRMALQMAVALTLAFVVGFGAFPGHWAWTVLTAFIVCSGARGRGDAAYKGVLRFAGAVAGTLVATVVTRAWAPEGVAEAAAIFVALYFGLLWREVNYAYWACAMTLVLALLARSTGVFGVALLGVRLEAILAGALCAVVATWFVFPIRTTDVIRRRLADALVALDEFVQHAHAAHDQKVARREHLDRRLGALEEVAAPVRWHRRLLRDHPEHPARWIDLAAELRDHAHAFAETEKPPEQRRTAIRKLIGASRRAIGNHGKPDAQGPAIGESLTIVREALRGGVTSEERRPSPR